jgi:hypothetical protein
MRYHTHIPGWNGDCQVCGEMEMYHQPSPPVKPSRISKMQSQLCKAYGKHLEQAIKQARKETK